MLAYLNDRFIEEDSAQLHVKDMSIQRGYAAFDFFRTTKKTPLFLNDHLDRFYYSAKEMRLPVFKSREELERIIKELINRSPAIDLGIRLMLTGGYAEDGYSISAPNLLITAKSQITASLNDFKNGISLMTYEHQRELPHIKSINYMTAVWLQPMLKKKNVNDVLYHQNKIITELPRSNIFMVTAGNILVTPVNNILLGVTRKKVIELALKNRMVEERNITIDELIRSKEVFITSTTKKILPVLQIDGQAIGNGQPGEITTALYQQFLNTEKNYTVPVI